LFEKPIARLVLEPPQMAMGSLLDLVDLCRNLGILAGYALSADVV
jgi:hypothetical protein